MKSSSSSLRWQIKFVSGLRTASKEGEVRPTSVANAKPRRLRRRPDPFAAVTIELREWFEAEPWHTSRELLERLQARHPGIYPDGLAVRLLGATHSGDAAMSAAANANGQFSDRESVRSPVDSPLRLDDAGASPTTPQGQHQ